MASKRRRQGKEPASSSRNEEVDPNSPEFYGITLPNAAAVARWKRLATLRHRQCRYMDEDLCQEMGILDGVEYLARRSGFYKPFTAGHLAYKGLTLEFLSTVVVNRVNKVPRSLDFQLGGVQRHLAAAKLEYILTADMTSGRYLGDNAFQPDELWDEITEQSVEKVPIYDPTKAKASSIRNPVFRYFHRLLTFTILGRTECGKVQSHDMHIMRASTSGVRLWVAAFLCDHFEAQAELKGNVQICIGAFVTPIAKHFKMDITEEPISREILLDRSCLYGQTFLKKRGNQLWWCIYERDGRKLFRLPNQPFTDITGHEDDDQRKANWTMFSFAHRNLMINEGNFGNMVDDDSDDEEDAYEEGGVAPGGYPNYDARFDSIDGHLASLNQQVTNIYDRQEEMFRMMQRWDSSFGPPPS